MPLYDLFCDCGHEATDVLKKIDEPLGECPECDAPLKRICGCRSFKLIYNNKTDLCSWGSEGYATSQYWNDYKAARARGENVKPDGED